MYFFDVNNFWLTVRGLGAASLKVSGELRGRREKEAELGEEQGREREKGRTWRVWGWAPSPLEASSALGILQMEGAAVQGSGTPGRARRDEATLSARMSGPISQSAPPGWERSWCQEPRGGKDRCVAGGRGGKDGILQALAVFWHSAGHCYTSTLRSKAVITQPS